MLANSDNKTPMSELCPSYGTELGHFAERLKSVIGDEALRSFAERVGVAPSSIHQYLAGKSDPSRATVIKIANAGNVSMLWLATGEGPMRRDQGHDETREPFPAYDPSQARQTKVYVLAGAGVPNQLIDTEPIAEIVIPVEFYKPSIVPIMVRGRSMEDTIMDGAFVGVDREDKWVISGEVYAIWIPNEGAVIKRLYLEPEKIICKSDNQKFADFFVNVKDIDEHFIQGRVKWVIQKY